MAFPPWLIFFSVCSVLVTKHACEGLGGFSKIHSNETNVRQNYMTENEAIINSLINTCLQNSYTYLSMFTYFDRDDVMLHGFGHYFQHQGQEEWECVNTLIKYQNLRGGRVILNDIKKPEREDWAGGLEAFVAALNIEKSSNAIFLEAHASATKNGDPQLASFITKEFLNWKVHVIKHMAEHIRDLKRVGPGFGEYQLDHDLEKHHHHHHHHHHHNGNHEHHDMHH